MNQKILESSANPLPDPQQDAHYEEIRSQVYQALQALPEKYKKVVLLKDIMGLRYEEIAQSLQIEIWTVKSRLYQGRMLLRHRLQPVR